MPRKTVFVSVCVGVCVFSRAHRRDRFLPMPLLLNSNQECVCGRSFDNAGAFTRHKKSCKKGKNRLASVLKQAQEAHLRKKRRVEGPFTNSGLSSTESLNPNALQVVDGMHVAIRDFRLAQTTGTCCRN